MNDDVDLIAVWQQMIGFSNMANLFDLDGGPSTWILKNDPYQIFGSIHVSIRMTEGVRVYPNPIVNRRLKHAL